MFIICHKSQFFTSRIFHKRNIQIFHQIFCLLQDYQAASLVAAFVCFRVAWRLSVSSLVSHLANSFLVKIIGATTVAPNRTPFPDSRLQFHKSGKEAEVRVHVGTGVAQVQRGRPSGRIAAVTAPTDRQALASRIQVNVALVCCYFWIRH